MSLTWKVWSETMVWGFLLLGEQPGKASSWMKCCSSFQSSGCPQAKLAAPIFHTWAMGMTPPGLPQGDKTSPEAL